MDKTILEVRNIKKYFTFKQGFISINNTLIKAVDGVNFIINEGETLGLVGESGCGKTTLVKLILLLESPSEGEILFKGANLLGMKREEIRQYRAFVQAVFQDPNDSLSPRMNVGKIVVEPIAINDNVSQACLKEKAVELLNTVGLSAVDISSYPHELSAGQKQRVALARALSLNPHLLILDEPVSSLDVSIQAQILNLLNELQHKFNLTVLLISHDLAVVHYMSTRIAVMYAGRIVELAESGQLRREPLHPYTRTLFSMSPAPHGRQLIDDINSSVGTSDKSQGAVSCSFYNKCPDADTICATQEPLLKDAGNGHQVACWSLSSRGALITP